MARGIGEDPNRSPASQIAQVEFPASRDEIIQTAEDNEAPVDVINFFKCLPKDNYRSAEEVLRASQEELEGVPGVPAKTARRIYQQLHRAGRA